MTILSQSHRFVTGAISAACLLGLSIAFAPAAKADDQMQQLMNKVGIPYQMTEGGSYKFNVSLGEGRTHLVFVSPNVEEVGSMKVREVYAAGYVSDRPLSGEVANRLLEDSERVKIGAWSVFEESKKYIASFTVKINANSRADDLKTAIVVAAKRADVIEKELTGKDDL